MNFKVEKREILKYAVIFIVFIMITSFLYYLQSQEDIVPVVTDVNTINLGDEGFYPTDLTILKGTTITFTTTRDNFFWPASNIHPSHSTYSEFDSKEPINPEDSWSFTFMDAGEWGYHDHLAPYFSGVITVTDSEETSFLDRCENNQGSIECWQKPLLLVLEEDGLEASLNLLTELYKTEPRFSNNCHGITHNIGIAAYKNFLEDKESVITPDAYYCGSGFYHGFMEAFLSVTRDVKSAREFCLYVDEKLATQSPDSGLQCFHGIGHGLMDLSVFTKFTEGTTNFDERSLTEPALEACEVASNREEELYRCSSAVFNSIANYYYNNEYNLEVNEDDPLWLCREQPEKYKEACYGNMNTSLYLVANGDFSKAASFIEHMEDEEHAPETMRYLSLTTALSVEDEEDSKKIVSVCRNLKEPLREPCLIGIAHGFLEHGTPELEYQDAIRFCTYPTLNDEERTVCLTAALSGLSELYGDDEAIAICNSIDDEYKQYCRYPYEN